MLLSFLTLSCFSFKNEVYRWGWRAIESKAVLEKVWWTEARKDWSSEFEVISTQARGSSELLWGRGGCSTWSGGGMLALLFAVSKPMLLRLRPKFYQMRAFMLRDEQLCAGNAHGL